MHTSVAIALALAALGSATKNSCST